MIEFDVRDYNTLKKAFSPELVDRAVGAALNRTQRKAATAISKMVREDYRRISQKKIKDALKVYPSYEGDAIQARVMRYTGTRIGRVHWKHGSAKTKMGSSIPGAKRVKTSRGLRYQARARYRKGGAFVTAKGGFVGIGKTSNSLQFFERIGESRLKIRKLTGPSVSQMVRGRNELAAIDHVVRNEFPKEFDSAMHQFISKAVGLR